MTRTKKGKKAPGAGYWGKRPIGGMYGGHGTEGKRPGVKRERAQGKQALLKEPREPEWDAREDVPSDALDDDWVSCWECAGDGVTHHDCGEDSCCCLYPEDNVRCGTCGGEGGWTGKQG